MTDDTMSIPDRLAAAVRANRPAATATILTGDGAGRKLLVLLPSLGVGEEVEERYGSLGDAGLDDAAADAARRQVEALRSARVALPAGQETRDVFIEVFPQAPTLLIFGAVHVAQALATLGKQMGYRVIVTDARAALATDERFPQVDRIVHAWPEEALADIVVTPTTDIAILTHDPKFDEPAIVGALRTPARYIGAIGSRKTNEDRRRRLAEAGVSEVDIARVHGPIGLDIGGETPEEMAVAIMAEMIAVRRGRSGGRLTSAAGRIHG
ncbi:MAG TPA: XdhC family protein [Thermomicrobiales bacterium]|jgi:xanthine dehydrogenase accessory factor|nr:XdhC family protein [Thermomicrobiales bacterium]